MILLDLATLFARSSPFVFLGMTAFALTLGLILHRLKKNNLQGERWLDFISYSFYSLAFVYFFRWSTIVDLPYLPDLPDFEVSLEKIAHSLQNYFYALAALSLLYPNKIAFWAQGKKVQHTFALITGTFCLGTLMAVIGWPWPHYLIGQGFHAIICLSAIGYALIKATQAHPFWKGIIFLICLALVGTELYYALIPHIQEYQWFPKRQLLLENAIIGTTYNRYQISELTINTLMLFFRFSLFLAVFHLVQESLLVWTKEDKSRLTKVTKGNETFLSSNGILAAIARTSKGAVILEIKGIRGEENETLAEPREMDISNTLTQVKEGFERWESPTSTDSHQGSYVVIPIYYHGAKIARLVLLWSIPYAYTATTIRRLEEISDLIAPTIHRHRQQIAMRHFSKESVLCSPKDLNQLTLKINKLLALHFCPTTCTLKLENPFTYNKSSAGIADPAEQHRETNLEHKGSYLGTFEVWFPKEKDIQDSFLARESIFWESLFQMLSQNMHSALRAHLRHQLDQLRKAMITTRDRTTWYQNLNTFFVTELHAKWLWVTSQTFEPSILNQASLEGTIAEQLHTLEPNEIKLVILQNENLLAIPLKGHQTTLWLGLPNSAYLNKYPNFHTEELWQSFFNQMIQTAVAVLDSLSLDEISADRLKLFQYEYMALKRHDIGNEFSKIKMDIDEICEESNQEEIKDLALEIKTKAEKLSQWIRPKAIPQAWEKPGSLGTLKERLLNDLEWVKKRKINVELDEMDDFDVQVPLISVYFAISNLCKNAVQAIKNQGSIVVTTVEKDDHILCSITNTGPKIPDEMIDKLFVEGFTQKETGGMGLALSRRSIRRFGGDLLLHSSTEEETRFDIHLPKSQEGESHE